MSNVKLGTYIINGVKVNPILNIRIWDDYFYKMTVKLPKNYPSTTMGKSSIVRNRGIFECHISEITQKDTSWWKHVESLNIDNTYSRYLAIRGFYIIPKLLGIQLTQDELIMLKGLGILCLHIGLHKIIKTINIIPSNTLIILRAYSDLTQNDNMRNKYYLSLGLNNVLKIFAEKYPECYINLYDTFINKSVDDIINVLVSVENTEQLVSYYTTAFGFKIYNYISNDTLMYESLSHILNIMSIKNTIIKSKL